MLRADEILHADLLRFLADLRHGQRLVIADAGLPAGANTATVDLGLSAGHPSFLHTLGVIARRGVFEAALLAHETRLRPVCATIRDILGDLPVEFLEHKRLSEQAMTADVFVRTGECTPYANIILIAGTSFSDVPPEGL